VIVDIRTPVALAEAIALFSMRAREGGFSLEGIMLQRYEPMGREGFVGVSRDPAIGPVVACGFGGTTIEVVRDLACGIPPLDTATVARMVDSLRGCPLLEAFRGAPAADRPAFEEVIGRVGALVEIAPEIVELDINPLKIRARGEGALALDGRAVLRRRTA
jgi:acyl-CoA synthetase (NDP forming)